MISDRGLGIRGGRGGGGGHKRGQKVDQFKDNERDPYKRWEERRESKSKAVGAEWIGGLFSSRVASLGLSLSD